MRALPLLEPRRAELEKCVFCPKLCRSACPVSNAEPRETITPWGKMSAAWMAAHGDTPCNGSHAAPAWACTGCFACREACDHRNPVTEVLLDARDALVRAGSAPEGAKRVLARFARHDAETRASARELAMHEGCDARATTALLVGCGYLRAAPREARDAVEAATRIAGGKVAVVEACCGLPLRLAGDARGFARHASTTATELARFRRVIVVDAGCALTLRQRFPEAGVDVPTRVELLVEAAARVLSELSPVRRDTDEPVRWHDPCQLGRGLGIYDAPRAILSRALGRAPDELEDRREYGVCSGAGGLLPSTMPETARDIADARLEAHKLAGGGRIVTACASSLIALRKRARASNVPVDDLVTWIASSLRHPSLG
jgi:dimethylglycine catabolism B